MPGFSFARGRGDTVLEYLLKARYQGHPEFDKMDRDMKRADDSARRTSRSFSSMGNSSRRMSMDMKTSVGQAAAHANALGASVDKVGGRFSSLSATVQKHSKLIGASMIGMGAAIAGATLLLYQQAVQAAAGAEQNWNRLTAALGKNIFDVKAVKAEYAGLVESVVEDTGRLRGDVIQTVGNLARVGLTSKETMEASAKSIGALAALTLGDYQSIQGTYAKVINTAALNIRTINTLGISTKKFDEVLAAHNLTREQWKDLSIDTRATLLNEATALMGGAAANEMYKESYEGMMNDITNAYKRFMTTVGNTLMPTIKNIMKWAIPMLQGLADWFMKLPEPMKQALILAPLVIAAIGMIGGAYILLAPLAGALAAIPGLMGLAGGASAAAAGTAAGSTFVSSLLAAIVLPAVLALAVPTVVLTVTELVIKPGAIKIAEQEKMPETKKWLERPLWSQLKDISGIATGGKLSKEGAGMMGERWFTEGAGSPYLGEKQFPNYWDWIKRGGIGGSYGRWKEGWGEKVKGQQWFGLGGGGWPDWMPKWPGTGGAGRKPLGEGLGSAAQEYGGRYLSKLTSVVPPTALTGTLTGGPGVGTGFKWPKIESPINFDKWKGAREWIQEKIYKPIKDIPGKIKAWIGKWSPFGTYEKWKGAREWIEEKVLTPIRQLPGKITAFLSSIPGRILSLWNKIPKPNLESIKKVFRDLPGQIWSWMMKLPGYFSSAWSSIAGAVRPHINNIINQINTLRRALGLGGTAYTVGSISTSSAVSSAQRVFSGPGPAGGDISGPLAAAGDIASLRIPGQGKPIFRGEFEGLRIDQAIMLPIADAAARVKLIQQYYDEASGTCSTCGPAGAPINPGLYAAGDSNPWSNTDYWKKLIIERAKALAQPYMNRIGLPNINLDTTKSIGGTAFYAFASKLFDPFHYDFYYGDVRSNAQTLAHRGGNCYDMTQLLLSVASAFGVHGSMQHGFWGRFPHVWAYFPGIGEMDPTAYVQRGGWDKRPGGLRLPSSVARVGTQALSLIGAGGDGVRLSAGMGIESGGKTLELHIHFDAPVYGLPDFNDKVMKVMDKAAGYVNLI